MKAELEALSWRVDTLQLQVALRRVPALGVVMLSRLASALGLGGGAKEAARLACLANVTAEAVASKPVISLPQAAQLSTALKVMHSHGAGAINVCEGPDGPLQGILTERDILCKHDFDDTLCTAPISGLMTPTVEVAAPDWSLERCLGVMLDKNFRHLPVLDTGPGAYGRVDAMLSMRDICRVLTAQEPTQLGKSRQGSALTIGDAVEAVRFGSAREQLGAFQPEVPPEHSIAEAVEAMRTAETGSVLIPLVAPSAASSAQAFGLFTERDLLKVLAAGPRDLRSVPVNEYMTSAADMIWADADFPVFDALQACRPIRVRVTHPVARVHVEMEPRARQRLVSSRVRASVRVAVRVRVSAWQHPYPYPNPSPYPYP